MCHMCGIMKTSDNTNRNSRAVDGLQASCRICHRLQRGLISSEQHAVLIEERRALQAQCPAKRQRLDDGINPQEVPSLVEALSQGQNRSSAARACEQQCTLKCTANDCAHVVAASVGEIAPADSAVGPSPSQRNAAGRDVNGAATSAPSTAQQLAPQLSASNPNVTSALPSEQAVPAAAAAQVGRPQAANAAMGALLPNIQAPPPDGPVQVSSGQCGMPHQWCLQPRHASCWCTL